MSTTIADAASAVPIASEKKRPKAKIVNALRTCISGVHTPD